MAQAFPPWETGELPPSPPPLSWRQLRSLIGPGLLMVGANIGGGEWLFGPLVTAQYGGRILWLANLSIILQVFYNLSVMRYTLYCGEPVFVGFFRTAPGPVFWAAFYLLVDLGSFLPYLASNSAVPLAAVILGRLPGAGDGHLVRMLSYGVFLSAFLPLVFGGKIYNSLERVMLAKLVIVLAYLSFVALFFVSSETKWEIVSGFFRAGDLPPGDFSWATLAAFAAVAGAGGLTNMMFSNYARDKGWGMGATVGAIPSAVGGRTIRLSHTGQVFDWRQGKERWSGWLRHIRREQIWLWGPGCVIGMALPAMFSYEYIRGIQNVSGHAVAAMAARAIADRHGEIFWFLTLLCGFLIMAPTQISQIDAICRRWTDVLWTGSKRLHRLEGNQVKYVYYTLLAVYLLWGLNALRLTPNPLVLAIASGVLWNFALGFSALHVLWVTRRLMPAGARPNWFQSAGLAACAVFFMGISAVALHQQWPAVVQWLRR